MIGYDQPMLQATAPVLAQEFDIVHEMKDTILCMQVKCPSLSDYDFDRPDDDNDWLSVALDRWGDLKVPTKLSVE